MNAADLQAPDAVTILRARGRRLHKIVRPGEIVAYDNWKRSTMFVERAPDLAALAALLAHLQDAPDGCAIWGAPADAGRMVQVRRLLKDDAETGDRATIVAVPKSWVALDLDGAPLPPGTDPRDLAACFAALPRLPDGFSGAGVVVQATTGHGIKPGQIRIRVWAILSRPITPAEARRWVRGVPHLDTGSVAASRPIYAASPTFEGVFDPLSVRLLTLPGPPVQVPSAEALAPPPAPPAKPLPAPSDTRAARYAFGALSRATARVREAQGQRHTAAVSECLGLARLIRDGLLTERAVADALAGALGEGRADKNEAAKLVAWGLENAEHRELPEGIAP